MDAQDVGWLKTLIIAYDQEHDWDADEDPDATDEMLSTCRMILAELQAAHPECRQCLRDATGPGWSVRPLPQVPGVTRHREPGRHPVLRAQR